jgi:hypothetical protein
LKNLKLTILKQQGFVGELMNIFGEGAHIMPLTGKGKYIQFNFPDVHIFTKGAIAPVYRLLESFEENNGVLNTKVFHLFDDKNRSYSHVSFLCMRGIWIRQEYSNEIATSNNLLELI